MPWEAALFPTGDHRTWRGSRSWMGFALHFSLIVFIGSCGVFYSFLILLFGGLPFGPSQHFPACFFFCFFPFLVLQSPPKNPNPPFGSWPLMVFYFSGCGQSLFWYVELKSGECFAFEEWFIWFFHPLFWMDESGAETNPLIHFVQRSCAIVVFVCIWMPKSCYLNNLFVWCVWFFVLAYLSWPPESSLVS